MCDVETGGTFNSKQKATIDVALVEVAIVVIDVQELKIIEEYSSIISPYKESLLYAKEAEEVHGITKAMIAEHGQPLKDVVRKIRTILTKYKNTRRKAILGGHNVMFDVEFLKYAFEFCGFDLSDLIGDIEDTWKIAGYSVGEQENYKLGTCCVKNGIDLVESHRAQGDIRANALLMIEYLKRLRGEGTAHVARESEEESRFRDSFEIDR